MVLTEYAQVTKMLGNGRLEALCFDGEKRLAHIRGKMRKKVWINQGDIILLSLREFQVSHHGVSRRQSSELTAVCARSGRQGGRDSEIHSEPGSTFAVCVGELTSLGDVGR